MILRQINEFVTIHVKYVSILIIINNLVSSRRRGSEWEVLEGLKDGQRFEKRPEVFNGFLHKKRKWPLKGWHKVRIITINSVL